MTDTATVAADTIARVSVRDAAEVAEAVAADHRTRQANAVRVALRILEAVSGNRADLRNEAAVAAAKVAVAALKEANGGELPGIPYI
ncbi:MAG: hypothetical protein WC965_00990 [Thiohalomonadaceae bacterium]